LRKNIENDYDEGDNDYYDNNNNDEDNVGVYEDVNDDGGGYGFDDGDGDDNGDDDDDDDLFHYRQGINLEQRLEYLSRAIMSAKSSNLRTSSSSEGEFLHELEEKLEVRILQQLIVM